MDRCNPQSRWGNSRQSLAQVAWQPAHTHTHTHGYMQCIVLRRHVNDRGHVTKEQTRTAQPNLHEQASLACVAGRYLNG